MWEPQERPLDWAFRRKAKTHFARPGKSSPANNTELLHDGSAEAREILRNASIASETFPAAGTLTSALNYLKGMDLSPERFSYTADFFGPTPEEWLLQLTARKGEPLVQIAAVAEDFPEWNPNYKPQDIYRDEVAIQRLKESL